VTWDGDRQAAVSDVYNTLHFTTPLIELPIDRVTPAEEQAYGRFREDYARLWRRYFDPVGMRFSLSDRQVRLETYILPLIQSTEYGALRYWAGGGTTPLDGATISPRSLFHFLAHLSPEVQAVSNAGRALGDWAMFRVDDSPVFERLVKLWVREQLFPEGAPEFGRDDARLFFEIPWTAGVRIGEPRAFDALREQLQALIPVVGAVQELKPAYQGVRVHRIELRKDRIWPDARADAKEKPYTPVLYSARIDGAWYLGSSLEALHELADRAAACRPGQRPAAQGEAVPVNSALALAPAAAVQSRPALRAYLEWESHRRAVGNLPVWYALYHSGLVDAGAPEAARQAAARRYLGYLPVSPDGAAYGYDRRAEEAVHPWHGSLRRPSLQPALADDSPLGRLLEQFRTVRADLRFREDGVHTVVTVQREQPRP
jgi:hypothetical protein